MNFRLLNSTDKYPPGPGGAGNPHRRAVGLTVGISVQICSNPAGMVLKRRLNGLIFEAIERAKDNLLKQLAIFSFHVVRLRRFGSKKAGQYHNNIDRQKVIAN